VRQRLSVLDLLYVPVPHTRTVAENPIEERVRRNKLAARRKHVRTRYTGTVVPSSTAFLMVESVTVVAPLFLRGPVLNNQRSFSDPRMHHNCTCNSFDYSSLSYVVVKLLKRFFFPFLRGKKRFIC
jgi:hypothetical protein